ncbi:MAG: sigma-70 family RNA polymerase sigma factor [Tannerella sp.]|jgi:RNA polymerase sigma factor (sigma-70 family)|nr:sigma-70 family RNA polymerase sigma factor [Tannerella sp.]
MLQKQFLAGDDSAFASIYKLYAKGLYAFGLSLHVATELIEDAIQDVFIEIYTNKPLLKNVSNLKSYLMMTFRNRLFYLVKCSENCVEMDVNFADYESEELDMQTILMEKEEEDKKESIVKLLLSELNANQREALYHRYVDDMSYMDIALIMNINYQSAKNLVHRAITKLKSVATSVHSPPPIF